MSNLRDQAARRRLDLSPITTSLTVAPPPHPSQTPSSGLSSNSLSAPFGYNPSSYTPISAVRQYNPQQWTSSPTVPSASDGSNHIPSRPDSEGNRSISYNIVPALVNWEATLISPHSNSSCPTTLFAPAEPTYINYI